MHPLLHAPIVAALGATLLFVVNQVHDLVRPLNPAADAVSAAEIARPPKVDAAAAAGRVATVVKQHGAALRVAPASDATALTILPCGDAWPVLAVQGGWVKLQLPDGSAWVGGGRVAVGSSAKAVDCPTDLPLVIGGDVVTQVDSGCLSLRTRPSRDAAMLDCVDNGHAYTMLDGPFDPGTGEDWIRVTSASTGTGWVLADHVYVP
jgi:hypothetical protein